MKNKIIFFATIIVAFFTTIIISIRFNDKIVVYHQHLEDKKIDACNDNDEAFCTHLPIVSIDTGNQQIPGEKRDGSTIKTTISLYDNIDTVNRLTDDPTKESSANIRYRGQSSMHFDKKGFLIKLIKENETENKISVLGMPSHDEWILNGPYLDKTLIRNYMMYNLSHEIMGHAPNVRFCELFVDGEYQGVYLMLESVSRGDESRVPISKYNPKYSYTSYIVRIDRGTTDPYGVVDSFSGYTYNRFNAMDIIYPGSTVITPELNRYIEEDISKFEKALYSFDYDSKKHGYESLIDVDSFVNYFIINEFFQNYDAGILSTYLYKDAKGKFGLYVWDFNNSLDNFQDAIYPYNEDYQFNDKTWFYMLIKDEKFTERIIRRYKLLRETFLSDEYLDKYIDETIKYLGKAIDRNFEVWGYTFDEDAKGLLYPKERNLHSYEEAVETMRQRLHDRGKFMDETIDTLRQFSHESKVKMFNH